jgi:hypothetical protein
MAAMHNIHLPKSLLAQAEAKKIKSVISTL